MTAIDALIDEVNAALASDRKSYTISAETYYTASGSRDTKFTSEVATQMARSLICAVGSRYAMIEKFKRGDNGEVIVFIILANTRDDWQVTSLQLRGMVLQSYGQPAEIIRHHVIDTRLDPESQ